MIARSKALRSLFLTDDHKGIRVDLADRVRVRLQVLHRAMSTDDLKIPGWNLHRLRGAPQRWAIAVNGPWRITFDWTGKDALAVDIEQYH